ncbi:hypothetical protein MNBD_NITROSPINAE03-1683 [hydrothermal vent metagenome]|uniref:HEPN domain-containing protein n=1 Tax=hydrothermal vent metagenome TaxID=652676 RepID=A0A3B1BE83_9ZZZZ
MPVTPNDFLLSAEELIKGSREIDFRNSASRAYYSCYLECRSFAEKLPEVPTGEGGAHMKVIRKFKEHIVKDESREYDEAVRKIGYQLIQVKSLRTKADYYIDGDYSRKDAEQTIEMVKRIKDKIVIVDS